MNDKEFIRFNKLLYNKEIIKKTILDFKDVCDCSLMEEEKYFLVKIKSKQPDLKNLNFEFANYVTSLMK